MLSMVCADVSAAVNIEQIYKFNTNWISNCVHYLQMKLNFLSFLKYCYVDGLECQIVIV